MDTHVKFKAIKLEISFFIYLETDEKYFKRSADFSWDMWHVGELIKSIEGLLFTHVII